MLDKTARDGRTNRYKYLNPTEQFTWKTVIFLDSLHQQKNCPVL
ncbi:MAG: hypothetical protein ACTSWN_02750 [Promethearchaeota archaeon]